MGFFGRVGNLLSGYISTKRGSSHEQVLKEQALEEELKKATPAVRSAAKDQLQRLKSAEEHNTSKSGVTIEDDEALSPPKPKKRTL